jgi:FAD/FMN-containing dehydrogenase
MTTTAALASAFAGQLIGPGHPGYDQARKICNGMIDRRPALIARCTSAADVQAALAYARAENLTVAVRGGGHSTPGYSTCDGGVVIDVGPMKHTGIDAQARAGRFGAGLTWGELDAATQQHGLAVTGGRITHTGVAGLTLGSGSGWLERKYGMSCQSLLSAEVVTADGHILRASAEENADLLWGLRGGGGNFGVVTEFEFRLHPVGPVVFAGMILHPRPAAPELLRFYRDFMEGAADEVGGGLALITAPPEPFVPEEARGKPACGLILVYVGEPAEGEQAFGPLLKWGDPWVKMVQPMPYAAVQQLLDPGNPWGINEYAKVDYLPELPAEAIDTLVEQAALARSPFTEIILCPLGGAASRMDRQAMALSTPDTRWMYFCMAKSLDPAAMGDEIAWARAFMAAMRPWTADKAPSNFLHPDEGAARLRASYGDDKFRRLVALKDKYDPGNIFSLNANIPPSSTDG